MKRLQRDAEMFRCGKTVSGADDHDTQIFVPKTKVKNNGVNTKVRENRERTSL